MKNVYHSDRTHISGTGSFVTVPQALLGVSENMKNAFKMESSLAYSEKQILGESVFSTDWFLLDIGAAKLGALDLDKVIRDCDLLKEIIRKKPERVKAMLESFSPDKSVKELVSGFDIVKELKLTEEDFVSQGGGLIGLILLGGAALLLAGCQSCTAHGHGGKRPTNHP
jgi:hypothetical protein